MFGTLFIKECKQILKSMVYYIYAAVFVIFLSSQLSGDLTDRMERPLPDQENYGQTSSHEPSAVMEKILANLMLETNRNSYATYPMGFYKEVTLNQRELDEVIQILEDCSGKSWEELTEDMEAHFHKYDQSSMEGAMAAQTGYSVPARESLSYEEFNRNMEKICGIVGAGSSYRKEAIQSGVSVPMTYEQAVEEYEALCEKDRVTGAVSRLFCDYAGIILSVLPIFLGVTRCLRDKRAQASQVVYAHEASAFCIIASRYLANVCMAALPVLVTSFVMQTPYQYHANTMEVSPDPLAFLKYNLVWLLPEIMIVLAVSFFFTELTESVISIFIQVFWAMASLMGAGTLAGDFAFKLVVRWNALGGTNEFLAQRQQLFINRGFYFLLSLAVLALTAVFYEKKRREGETLYGKIFKRRK